MIFKKLFLKIKRYFFYKYHGFYPETLEDIRKLVYVQKYLDTHERGKTKKYKIYNDYINRSLKK